MGDFKEVRYERLYVMVPGSDKLRKTAGGRLQHLLNDGWREIERSQTGDYTKDVSFSVDHTQPGTLEGFEESAENGQPVNVVTVPLTLEA